MAKYKKCWRYCCWTLPTKVGAWVDKRTRKLGMFLGFEVDDIEDDEIMKDSKIKMEAPPWPNIVDMLVTQVPIAERIYFEREKNKGLVLIFNLTNISAIYGKIM
jgi:hypothetical protein